MRPDLRGWRCDRGEGADGRGRALIARSLWSRWEMQVSEGGCSPRETVPAPLSRCSACLLFGSLFFYFFKQVCL